MDFIYTRASGVLVWLAQYDVNRTPSFQNMATYDRSLGNWFCDHNYWRRLWIIQEVGLARKLKVCFGDNSLDWRSFLRPLPNWEMPAYQYIKNLEEKRQGRHGDSNRLETLLETIQYAKCEEPRDQIYGLLGLAHDCYGQQEADYTKDLFDVYADVIRFFYGQKNSHGNTTKRTDRAMRIVRFSQLIQRLLGSPIIPSIVNAEPTEVFQAIGAIAGEVVLIGPTYEEMISLHAANKRWKLIIEQTHRFEKQKQMLREANEAYNLALVNMSIAEFDRICGLQPRDMYSRAVMAPRKWNSNEGD